MWYGNYCKRYYVGRTYPNHLVAIASRFGATSNVVSLVTIPSFRFLQMFHFGFLSSVHFWFGLFQRQTVPSSLSDELISVPTYILAKSSP